MSVLLTSAKFQVYFRTLYSVLRDAEHAAWWFGAILSEECAASRYLQM